MPLLVGLLSLCHFLHTRLQAMRLLQALLAEAPALRERLGLADVPHPPGVTPRQWLQWWQWASQLLVLDGDPRPEGN